MKATWFFLFTLFLIHGKIFSNSSPLNFGELVEQLMEPKDTFTIDQLMNCAVKYFKVTRVTEDDWYAVKICTGTSGHPETEPIRHQDLEAFCLNAIIEGYQKEGYMLADELVKESKELYKLNLGINKEDRLLRAQGMLYCLMFNNEALKKALLDSYQATKNELSFVIVKK